MNNIPVFDNKSEKTWTLICFFIEFGDFKSTQRTEY
jgi:hypothetical protein